MVNLYDVMAYLYDSDWWKYDPKWDHLTDSEIGKLFEDRIHHYEMLGWQFEAPCAEDALWLL